MEIKEEEVGEEEEEEVRGGGGIGRRRRRKRWEEEREVGGGGGGEIRKNTYDSLYLNKFSNCLPVTFVGLTSTGAITIIVI